jgi:hypothetical protein
MALYYVNMNSQPNRDHEVHTTDCSFMPDSDNRIYLGDFASCQPAIAKARQYFAQSNGCYFCARQCHAQ